MGRQTKPRDEHRSVTSAEILPPNWGQLLQVETPVSDDLVERLNKNWVESIRVLINHNARAGKGRRVASNNVQQISVYRALTEAGGLRPQDAVKTSGLLNAPDWDTVDETEKSRVRSNLSRLARMFSRAGLSFPRLQEGRRWRRSQHSSGDDVHGAVSTASTLPRTEDIATAMARIQKILEQDGCLYAHQVVEFYRLMVVERKPYREAVLMAFEIRHWADTLANAVTGNARKILNRYRNKLAKHGITLPMGEAGRPKESRTVLKTRRRHRIDIACAFPGWKRHLRQADHIRWQWASGEIPASRCIATLLDIVGCKNIPAMTAAWNLVVGSVGGSYLPTADRLLTVAVAFSTRGVGEGMRAWRSVITLQEDLVVNAVPPLDPPGASGTNAASKGGCN